MRKNKLRKDFFRKEFFLKIESFGEAAERKIYRVYRLP